MITKIPAAQRKGFDHGWLKTYHLFSFADYYDPANIHFGNVRVFNDDHIDAQQGFGAHSHADMEIVTIVHQGQLTHQDSMGNTGLISPGEVQYMSAGTGVTHAEVNQGKERLHLYQIWILPRRENLKPTYGQKSFDATQPNVLVPVASGFGHDSAIEIQADAAIFKAELLADSELTHPIAQGRGALVYVQEGNININGTALEEGDQARITEETNLELSSAKDAKIILIETVL